MNSYNYSYNVLINRLEAFAAGHFLIKRFTHGQIDMADQLQDDQYPFMHVTPDTIEPVPGAMNFGFHIMFADIPRDKEYKAEYQREVISDCIRLGQDLIAEVKNGLELFGFDVQLLDTPVFEPFMEEQKNTVTGVAFTLKLSVPWDWSACDIPAIWSVGGASGSGGSGTGYGIELQTNGVDNVVQTKLNLVEGTNITITDLGNGSVTIDAGGGTVDYVSTAFNANHTTATGNQYVIGDRVWYNGSVYQCIANNDAINPTNTTYWTLVAVGNRLRQTPVDWNATTGDFQILNKPTIPAAQIQSDWTQANTGALDYIKNKPTITTPVNADWSASSGLAQILNKPFVPSTLDSLTDVNAPTPTNGQVLTYNTSTGQWVASTPSGGGSGTVTSVGLTMPAAFSVSGSPVTTSGTLAVTGAGSSAQYVRGDGTLATFPTLPATVGDMLKSVYDLQDIGIVEAAHKEMVAVINKTGASVPAGSIVYLKTSSASGTFPEIVLATATTESGSSKTMGAVWQTIANDATGYVVTSGEVSNLDTSAYSIGDRLWLGTTAGSVTTTPPAEPNHTVFIGTVTRSQNTNGRILYAIQNGYELNELHGVQISTEANRQVLVYDSATSLWINRLLQAADMPTGIDAANIGTGVVSNTEFGYLDGVTSAIQTQLNAKVNSTLLYQSQNATNIPAASTYFGCLFGGALSIVSADTLRRTPIATAGTLTKLYVQTSTAQPATGSLVCTVRKNSVDQALTLTIAAGSAAGVFTDLVNSVSVVAGDLLGMKFQNNAPATVSANVLSNQVLLNI